MTLREHADAWLDYITPFRAPTTITRYRQALRAFLVWAGEAEPEGLTVDDVRAWHRGRANTMAPATMSTETTIIKKLLKEAKRADLADTLESPPVRRTPRNLGVTWAQIRRALLKRQEPERWALVLLLNSGLRIGELLHLRAEDVKGKNIEIREHPDWRPKTKGSTRTIPKSAEASKCLKHLTGKPHLCPWTADHLRDYLEETCERAALRRLQPHKLRHLFITHLGELGFHVEVARKLAGHSSLQTTLLYLHMEDSALNKAMGNFR